MSILEEKATKIWADKGRLWMSVGNLAVDGRLLTEEEAHFCSVYFDQKIRIPLEFKLEKTIPKLMADFCEKMVARIDLEIKDLHTKNDNARFQGVSYPERRKLYGDRIAELEVMKQAYTGRKFRIKKGLTLSRDDVVSIKRLGLETFIRFFYNDICDDKRG